MIQKNQPRTAELIFFEHRAVLIFFANFYGMILSTHSVLKIIRKAPAA